MRAPFAYKHTELHTFYFSFLRQLYVNPVKERQVKSVCPFVLAFFSRLKVFWIGTNHEKARDSFFWHTVLNSEEKRKPCVRSADIPCAHRKALDLCFTFPSCLFTPWYTWKSAVLRIGQTKTRRPSFGESISCPVFRS